MLSSLLTPLPDLTCRTGVVDDKELTVSSDQGNVLTVYIHPTLSIIGEQCCTLNDLPRLIKMVMFTSSVSEIG